MTKPEGFVIVKECSDGNETVGSAWLETATFPPTATLSEVYAWFEMRHRYKGRLMICADGTAA